MKFNFKITTWQEAEVSEEDEQIILEKIKSEEIKSINDIYNSVDSCTWENLLDSEVPLTPKTNGGKSTIQVLDDNGKIIHEN